MLFKILIDIRKKYISKIPTQKLKSKPNLPVKSSSLECIRSMEKFGTDLPSNRNLNFKRKNSCPEYLTVETECHFDKICWVCKKPWKDPVLLKTSLVIFCGSCRDHWIKEESLCPQTKSCLGKDDFMRLPF